MRRATCAGRSPEVDHGHGHDQVLVGDADHGHARTPRQGPAHRGTGSLTRAGVGVACTLGGRQRTQEALTRSASEAWAPYIPRMSLEWEQVVVDAADPVMLGRWWAHALGWVVLNDAPDEFEIRPTADRLPGLIFEPLGEAKRGKNRLHLDFRPDDQHTEVARLLGLGARHVDIGQGQQSWVVLADPEGNEFCVLSTKRT